jgi:hypothetical protein
MMIASCKRFDGWALGSDKFGECSGERQGKFGNGSVPPQPTPKDKFASKPNQPREKPSEKTSEKPSEKPSGKPSEKPCEEPHPKPKPRSIRFHCEFCGKDGRKREFCYKRRREARIAKEWANKDKYHPSSGVLEPRVQMPRAKASVRTVPAWGERKAAGGVAGGVKPVRPVWSLQGASLVFVLVRSLGLVQEVVVLVVGLESLQVVSLLGVLPLVLNTGMGGVVAWRWRGGTIHGFPFVVLVLLQVERVGSLIVVTVVVFVAVALVGWMLLTLLFRKWPDTGFTPLGLTPVLSHFIVLTLCFVLQVGRPGEHLVDIGGGSPASYPGGDMFVHHFRGWWTRMSEL